MSDSANSTTACAAGQSLCDVLQNQVELIVIPALLFGLFLLILIALVISRSCQNGGRIKDSDAHEYRTSSRVLRGIDAPAEFNVMEHEEIQMRAQPPPASAAVPQTATERRPDTFQLLSALPLTFSTEQQHDVSLYRAVADGQPVVIKALREPASASQRESFLGFAHFLAEIGPHPSLPKLLGLSSLHTPVMIIVEELEHGDLLSFLWRCRQDVPGRAAPCDLTERRVFTMGAQIASALEYLHGKSYMHGNVRARSVLVGRDLSVRLWGLSPAYRRRTAADSPATAQSLSARKWQAPEVLARRAQTLSSDVWSFGILLYEMVTLGDPPFPDVMASELLQHLQRKNMMKKPPNCSRTLYSVMEACCKWKASSRASWPELIRKLQSGERSASERTVIRVSEPLDVGKYMRDAGYEESLNFAVL